MNISKNKEIIAINFNIYECMNNIFAIEVVWTNFFNINCSDWPCYDVYSSKNNNYNIDWNWKNWEQILVDIKKIILNYIELWNLKSNILKYNIWFGFIDWDIEIINQKSKD
jgi:hypothetical protein